MRTRIASRSSSGLALGALAFVAFVIGTAELMVVGILDLIADGTRVSVGTAGGLVTAYALVATGIGMLLAVRVLTRSLHGLVAGVATAIAAGLVPAERRGQAIAGIAAGSLIGGAVISSHGAGASVLVAALVSAIALPATWATRHLGAAADDTVCAPALVPQGSC